MSKDKLESPPAFLLHVDDFLNDEKVVIMDDATRGLFILLLCKLWKLGTILDDEAFAEATLRPTTKETFSASWMMIRATLKPSEADPKRLVSPRLERERDAWIRKATAARESGQRGGRARASGLRSNPTTVANANALATVEPALNGSKAPLERQLSNVEGISMNGVTTLRSVTPSAEEATAKPPLSDDEAPLGSEDLALPPATFSGPTAALALSRWFVATGMERGVISETHRLEPDRIALHPDEIKAANRLLATYAEPVIRAAAETMFARRALPKIHPDYLRSWPTLAFLADRWPMFEAAPTSVKSQRLADTLAHRDSLDA